MIVDATRRCHCCREVQTSFHSVRRSLAGAASGARLSLPLEVKFLDTPLIAPGTPLPSLLLTPGEPLLGNQYEMRQVECAGGSFVDSQARR